MKIHTSGSGRPILLIHGIPGSAGAWDPMVSELADDHLLLRPDLLGFGESPRPSHSGELWADSQARALASALDGLETRPEAVVGHDFGGPVALSLAATRPDLVPRLALCATNAFPDTPVPLPIAAVTWPLAGPVAERLLFSGPSLAMMLRQGAGAPAPRLDRHVYLGDGGQQRSIRTIFASALRDIDRLYAPLERTLRALEIPVLVAWGTRDPFFVVEQARRTAEAAGGRLALYEDCGHFVPAERPRELADDLRGLLALRAAAAAA